MSIAARLLVLSCLVASLALPASATAASSAVKLSLQQSKVVKLAPGELPYANVDSISTDGCGKAGVPIAVGWTGSGILTTGPTFYAGSPVAKGFRLGLRAPLAAGSIRATTVCATGPVGARLVTKRAGGTISCGAATALGIGVSRWWAYTTSALLGMPVGTNRWMSDMGEGAEATAICVAKTAFTKVASVKKTGSFAAGATSATLVAACPRGKRALSWGVSAPVMTGNTWVGDGTSISVPFVQSAVPGTAAWKISLRTPDGKPAIAAAPIAAWATCGIPRVR